ncbi:MAG: FHA domain-containing protein [Verrucomicrobiota bacterium]
MSEEEADPPVLRLHPDLEKLLGVGSGVTDEDLLAAYASKLALVRQRAASGPRPARMANQKRLDRLEQLRGEVESYASRARAYALYERSRAAHREGHLARAVAACRKGLEQLERAPDDELGLLFAELQLELGPAFRQFEAGGGAEDRTSPTVHSSAADTDPPSSPGSGAPPEASPPAPPPAAAPGSEVEPLPVRSAPTAPVSPPPPAEGVDPSPAMDSSSSPKCEEEPPPSPPVEPLPSPSVEPPPRPPPSVLEPASTVAPAAADRFTLRVARRRLHVFTARELSFGRGEEADVPLTATFPGNPKAAVIAYRSLSRQHCEVAWDGSALVVQDGWQRHPRAERRPSSQGVRLGGETVSTAHWSGRSGQILSLTPSEPAAHIPHWRLFALDAFTQAKSAPAELRAAFADNEHVGVFFRRGDLVREDVLMLWGPVNLRVLGYLSEDVWIVPEGAGFRLGPARRLVPLAPDVSIFPGVDLLALGHVAALPFDQAQKEYS